MTDYLDPRFLHFALQFNSFSIIDGFLIKFKGIQKDVQVAGEPFPLEDLTLNLTETEDSTLSIWMPVRRAFPQSLKRWVRIFLH
jgi:hypothetical protein